MSSRFSIVCPDNDLESRTILNIARQKGIPYVPIGGDWQQTVKTDRLKDEQLTRLAGTTEVLLVELPHPDLRRQIEAAGHQVCSIDHHGEAAEGPSSLEQFARLTGRPHPHRGPMEDRRGRTRFPAWSCRSGCVL